MPDRPDFGIFCRSLTGDMFYSSFSRIACMVGPSPGFVECIGLTFVISVSLSVLCPCASDALPLCDADARLRG